MAVARPLAAALPRMQCMSIISFDLAVLEPLTVRIVLMGAAAGEAVEVAAFDCAQGFIECFLYRIAFKKLHVEMS